MSKRRRFSSEYKREAVELASHPSVSVAQVARDLGIRPNLLSRWRREIDQMGKTAFGGSGTPRDEEIAKLKRENARLKKERDFLRDAATFFARESK